MVVVPVLIPVSMPLDVPIVPTAVLLLAQVPPGVNVVYAASDPTQTLSGPVGGVDDATTVITIVTAQPAT
jgi:hypothetical protein